MDPEYLKARMKLDYRNSKFLGCFPKKRKRAKRV